jgi:hypothetical protein
VAAGWTYMHVQAMYQRQGSPYREVGVILSTKGNLRVKQVRIITKVFSEQEAAHFPPPRTWDYHIKLTKDALELINSKIYPLPQRMTQELDKWINKMLEQGFISISSLNYGSPTFIVTKKDGSQRIV